MPRTCKTHPPALKAKVALEAIKAQRRTTEIAQAYGVHPNLVKSWKRLLVELLAEILTPQTAPSLPVADREKEGLYRQIGFSRELVGQLDFEANGRFQHPRISASCWTCRAPATTTRQRQSLPSTSGSCVSTTNSFGTPYFAADAWPRGRAARHQSQTRATANALDGHRSALTQTGAALLHLRPFP
ncbi:MAG: hypothetical protein ABL995_18885 [Bryobacteraceae bacterium]